MRFVIGMEFDMNDESISRGTCLKFEFVFDVFFRFHRFEKQMELEQKAFEDSKNRIITEFAAEKDRLIKEIHQKEEELEIQREKLLKDKKEMAEQLNREFTEKVRMIEKRNQVKKDSHFLFIMDSYMILIGTQIHTNVCVAVRD